MRATPLNCLDALKAYTTAYRREAGHAAVMLAAGKSV
jgi:hypothetical protein